MTELGASLWMQLEASGASDQAISEAVGVDRTTVARWRRSGSVGKSTRRVAEVRLAAERLSETLTAGSTRELREDLRRTIASASLVLGRLDTMTHDEVLSAVIGALVRAVPGIRLTVAPAFRGKLSRQLHTPLHYLVGVEIEMDSPHKNERPTAAEVIGHVGDALASSWRDLGIHLRTGPAPEWPPTRQPSAIVQIPIVERPRRPPAGAADSLPTGMGRCVVVVAPIYGYGELLAALLAEALNLGLVDLRYEEEPPKQADIRDGRTRAAVARAQLDAKERRARRLLEEANDGVVWCIAGDLVERLQTELVAVSGSTTLIGIGHGHRWAETGLAVHRTSIKSQLRTSRLAGRLPRQRSQGGTSIEVDYASEDVVPSSTAKTADVDLIADATVLTAIEILDRLGVPERLWSNGWLANLRDAQRLAELRDEIARRSTTVDVRRPGWK